MFVCTLTSCLQFQILISYSYFQGEPYAAEAVTFTKEQVNQRDVDLEIESMNKGGTFLGRLTVPGTRPFDLGLGLVEAGLAKLHPFFDTSTPVGRQLASAQKAAQDNKLKVCMATHLLDYDCIFGKQSSKSDIASSIARSGKAMIHQQKQKKRTALCMHQQPPWRLKSFHV